MTKHIVAIHAHPDDVETLAAGTLALLAAHGHRVTIVTMTAGDCGSVEHGREETAAIRKSEGARAAAVIGATYRCADFPDLGVFNDEPSRRRVVELLRSTSPDVVLAPSPADYHPDHEATSTLVRDACFAVGIPNYRTGPSPILEFIPHLYFVDPIEGRDRGGQRIEPDFAVDVAAFMDKKRAMLACHESQRSWVLRQHGIDNYVQSMVDWSAVRGRSFGVSFAEGFRHYRGHPYPRSPLLQELVGAARLPK